MKIKSFLLVSLLAAATFASAHTTRAQTLSTTNQPPQSQGSFFNTVVGYFSSFNTNLDSTFGANRGAVWTGVDAIQGGPVSLANSLGVSYDLWRPSATTNTPGNLAVSLESVTRTGGVEGALISQQAGAGLSFIVHDTRLTLYGACGVNLSGNNNCFGEAGLRVTKALSDHTFAGVAAALQFPGNRQIFTALIGFTF